MKISAGTIGIQLAILFWCLFMGVTAISIGVGAIYPPLNLIAKPFVCPNGQMTFNESTSNPLPGTTYTIIGWYCLDSQKEKATPLDIFQIAVPAGLIYGLVLEVLVLIAIVAFRLRSPASPAQPAVAPARHSASTGSVSPASHPAQRTPASPDTAARMKELNHLRAQQLITEVEYQQKRAEILKGL